MPTSLHKAINQAVAQYIQLQGTTFSTSLYQDIINQVERQLIEIVLNKTQGNKSKAAKILGISRVTLIKKINFLVIDS
ncbi:MAG: Fis family transcriptional regulator [Gammaproteobacteria bacterium]|nr:Fis family transcriptional regulator [Gammaproteobacteria bacterium]